MRLCCGIESCGVLHNILGCDGRLRELIKWLFISIRIKKYYYQTLEMRSYCLSSEFSAVLRRVAVYLCLVCHQLVLTKLMLNPSNRGRVVHWKWNKDLLKRASTTVSLFVRALRCQATMGKREKDSESENTL